MKKALLIFGIVAICSKSFAQTTYTTTTFGKWDDPARWAGGVAPPDIIGTGDIININHNTFIISKDIINNRTINITAGAGYQDGATITNNGKIIIASNGSLSGNRYAGNFTNNYAIDNNGWIRQVKDLVNNGYIFNQGHIYNYEKLFYDGVQMNCSDWGRLINNNVLCNSSAGYVDNDCGSSTTGAPAINSCAALKATIMNGTLAVGETAKSDGIKLYPNPTTGIFSIGFGNIDLKKSQIQIFDLTGKAISSKNTQKNNNALTVDISNVPKGNYILKIKTSDGKETIRKIIKQ